MCRVFVYGCSGLFAALGCLTDADRALVSVIVVIAGSCFSAIAASHASGVQFPFPEVVVAHGRRSQLAICMVGGFDGCGSTRSTSNLHLDMLFFHVGSFPIHQFRNFDVTDFGALGDR